MSNSVPPLASAVSVSVVMIVQDEAENLKRCLPSLDWADEVVVLDSGSKDDSKALVEASGAKFYSSKEWPGFGPQRRDAQALAASDWIFMLDADEVLSDELIESIRQKVALNDCTKLYQVDRLSSAFGKYIRHSGWSPDLIVRLYPRDKTQYDEALVHEKVLEPKGMRLEVLKGDLFHHTYDNLHHYLDKTTGYLKAWADQREGVKSSSLSTALVHALAVFIKMYILKAGFLDGRHGFVLAWLTANSNFVKYTDLWLREEAKKPKK